ncbi:unnamed protein product [Prunus brigantina]
MMYRTLDHVRTPASLPTFGITCRRTNRHILPILTDYLRIPARTCQNDVYHTGILSSARIQLLLRPSVNTEEGPSGPLSPTPVS